MSTQFPKASGEDSKVVSSNLLDSILKAWKKGDVVIVRSGHIFTYTEQNAIKLKKIMEDGDNCEGVALPSDPEDSLCIHCHLHKRPQEFKNHPVSIKIWAVILNECS